MTSLTLPTLLTDDTMTLVVSWRIGTKVHLRRVDKMQDVEDELRMVVKAVYADVKDRTVEAWTPEADLSPEVVLSLPVADVGAAPVLAREIDSYGTLLKALGAASQLPKLAADKLPAAELNFYALVVGEVQQPRTVWIRRTNPRRSLRRGRFFTTLQDVLVKVEAPLFGFEDDLDLIAADGQLLVLQQSAFRAIFRENQDLKDQVPDWVTDVTQHLPMDETSKALLAERCLKDSRLRRRLESIKARGHLQDVKPAALKAVMRKQGLDPKKYFNAQGELHFSDETLPDVLKVLNEDLFVGELSKTMFRADKKAVHS